MALGSACAAGPFHQEMAGLCALGGPGSASTPVEPGRSFGARYVRGLHASATSNAAAYGYSVTITATFGVLSTMRDIPGMPQTLSFVMGAVLAFAVVEAAASRGYRHELEDEPSSIKALGSSISIFSVGGALGFVFAGMWLVGGLVVWPLGSFVATVI